MLLITPIPLLFFERNSKWSVIRYITEYYWVIIGELLVFSVSIILFGIYTNLINRKVWLTGRKKVTILIISELILFVEGGVFLCYLLKNIQFTWYYFLSLTVYGLALGIGIMVYDLKPNKPKIASPNETTPGI